ncbi:MAG: DUF1643 domain-containing protein [Silicimonas sp.]|nr:DUF1643 domain-containing protein [Silicimonas sp.]
MITRTHEANGRISEAVYSDCERYRYALTRLWEPKGKRLLYIMLNPSKATELANDPTIERCERRAKILGYGAFRVCNLFALRETEPARLKKAKRPEGRNNSEQLLSAVDWCDDVLCAWGVHGTHRDQAKTLIPFLLQTERPLLALGVTKEGHPRHPLYVSYKTLPAPFAAN